MPRFIERRAPRACAALLAAFAGLSHASLATAHAVVGDRVFPATLTVDDPGVGDEFDTQFDHLKSPDGNGDTMNVNTVSYEWDKLITKNLAFSVASQYVSQNPPNGAAAKGWDNIELGVKYLAYTNAEHEFMASVGLAAEIGGTGAKSIASPYSTFTPTVYLGKGFGDLPASLGYLRPLALTAQLGPNLTTASSDQGPNAFGWGLTLQYSLPYLQQQVKNLGLPQPFSNMILVVEAPMSTCTAGACAGQTTGTLNPGVLWLNRYGQFGVEAQIPVNRATGNHVGVILDAHLYFDDLFPGSLGKPLF
ncbi:hypothetical protein ACVBGC_26400 [Burkholderia stagnalis]